MKPRERVLAALKHRPADRIPRFEIWVDGLLANLGQTDSQSASVNLGQDCVMLPSHMPPGSNAWRTGIDEWGRVWQDGMYCDGVVDTATDLARYSTPHETAVQCFDPGHIDRVRTQYPDHCLIYGTHIGPFTAGYMAMGFARFFLRLYDDRAFIHRLLENRTEWCIAMYQQAIRCGAEVVVLGDDAGHSDGPMIAPDLWRELVLPYHRRIVEVLDVPVIWHSDGDVVPLLPAAIEAGFAGFHGMEPNAGVDLAAVKREFGCDLVLIGNVDVSVLAGNDLAAVRADVDRCLEQGGSEGYMLASCNSIFDGLNPAAVAEFFRYAGEVC